MSPRCCDVLIQPSPWNANRMPRLDLRMEHGVTGMMTLRRMVEEGESWHEIMQYCNEILPNFATFPQMLGQDWIHIQAAAQSVPNWCGCQERPNYSILCVCRLSRKKPLARTMTKVNLKKNGRSRKRTNVNQWDCQSEMCEDPTAKSLWCLCGGLKAIC